MRRSWWVAATLTLLACGACGARVTVDGAIGTGTGTGTGTGGAGGGSTAVEQARIDRGCAPTDGPAIVLTLDTAPDCADPVGPGLQITISAPVLAGLHAGETLTVNSDGNAPVQGVRVTQVGQGSSVLLVSQGSVVLTTIVVDQSMTGSYEVTFADGTNAHGSFSAVWCLGQSTCG